MNEFPPVNAQGQPTGNADKHINHYLSRNIKILARHIADQRKEVILQQPIIDRPLNINLQSKICTQADVEAPWSRYWIERELKKTFVYHRKHWEEAFVLQALYEHGMLSPGVHGLGLGCGQEPLPSYLASRGCRILASDKPGSAAGTQSWIQTNQHMASKEILYIKEYLDEDTFNKNVAIRYIDMNQLPHELDQSFDFCWSVCVIEHLGSIRNGLDFLRNSLRLLKPGGISVHTTEYNLLATEHTIDNWGSVLFQKKHFEALQKEMPQLGGRIIGCDFHHGDGLFDQYADCPPWEHQDFAGFKGNCGMNVEAPHLKVCFDGFVYTCFGVILQKNR